MIPVGGLAHIHPSLQPLLVDIDQIHPHPDNPRNGDTDAIATSIEINGLYRPIYAQRDGTILAGNHTYAAALELGAQQLPVVFLDVDHDQATRIMLVDNRAADLGRYDDALLLDLLTGLDQTSQGLLGTGYDDLALEDLTDALRRAEHTPLLPDDRPTLAEKFIVPPWTVLDARTGIWQDRKHRWLALGIQSEIGRNADHMGTGPTGQSLRDNPLQYAQANRNPTVMSYTQGDGTSIFDPVLCELVYRWFLPPAGTVLDPFAGGSVRGILAALLGHPYTGIELRKEQIVANYEQSGEILDDLHPVWVEGDSRDLLGGFDGRYDLLFTSPPYHDLEKYSDDPADLSTMKWDPFLDAYRDIIAKAAARLKDDRFAVWVVGDIRDQKTGNYRNLIGETVRAFHDAGMALYNEAILVTPPGSLPVRTAQQFTVSRKLGKTHQNILVFIKGTGETATKDCGPVEVSVPDFV